MAKRIEVIHTAGRDPSINLPYAPAVKVTVSFRASSNASMAALTVTSGWFWLLVRWVMPRFGVVTISLYLSDQSVAEPP